MAGRQPGLTREAALDQPQQRAKGDLLLGSKPLAAAPVTFTLPPHPQAAAQPVQGSEAYSHQTIEAGHHWHCRGQALVRDRVGPAFISRWGRRMGALQGPELLPPPTSDGEQLFKPTLRQTCPSQEAQAQYAFKDSMIRGILQFTLPIALCCVLHRYGSREIHCVVLLEG